MTQAITMQKFVYVAETAHEDFPDWLFLFENFLTLSEIDSTDETGKVTAKKHLIHACGALAVKLIRGMAKPEDVTYLLLKEALEKYCSPKDKTALMFRFDSLKQMDNETIQNFVLRLRPVGIAAGIQATAIEGELIRRIIQNTNIEEARLKAMETDMTVAKLVLWESTRRVHQQCTAMRNESREQGINFVSHAKKRKSEDDDSRTRKNKLCYHCGNDFPHKGDGKCPAKGKTCSVCGIMNHFAKVCKKGNGQSNQGQSNQSGAAQSKSSNNVSKKIYHVADNKEDKKNESEEFKMFKKFYSWMNSVDDEGKPSSDTE